MSKIREAQTQHQRPNCLLWIALPITIIYSLNLISFSNGQVSYILRDQFPFVWQQDEVVNDGYVEDQFVPSSEYSLSYSNSLGRADDEFSLEMEPIPMAIPMDDLDSRLRMVLVDDDYYYEYDNGNGNAGSRNKGRRRGEEEDEDDDDDENFDTVFDKKEDFDDDKELEKEFSDDDKELEKEFNDDDSDDIDDYPYGYGGYNENFGKVKDKKGPRRKKWNYKNYNQFSVYKYDKHPLDKYGSGWSSKHGTKQSHTYHRYAEHPLEKYGWDDNPYPALSSGLAHTFTYLKRKFAEKNAQHYHNHGHHGGHGHSEHPLKYGWGSTGYPYPEFSAGLSDTYGFLKNKIAHKKTFHHHKHYGW